MIRDERKVYKKEYYEKHKKELILYQKEYQKKYYEIHKEDIKIKYRDYRKEYYKKNKEKIDIQTKKYKLLNAEQYKIYNREYRKQKRLSDPLYKLKSNMRNAIKNSFNYIGSKKQTKTELILGCSFNEFKIYIEKQFKPWMNWDNYGKYNGKRNFGWDIDHYIRLSTAKTEKDIIKLNHYTNLKPLDSYINRTVKR